MAEFGQAVAQNMKGNNEQEKEIKMNKHPKAWSILLLSISIAASHEQCFASSFSQTWCPKGTVSVGDSKAKVRAYCGEPASIQKSEASVGRQSGRLSGGSYSGRTSEKAIPIEDWLYNYGPRESMKELRFVDGDLKGVDISRRHMNKQKEGSLLQQKTVIPFAMQHPANFNLIADNKIKNKIISDNYNSVAH